MLGYDTIDAKYGLNGSNKDKVINLINLISEGLWHIVSCFLVVKNHLPWRLSTSIALRATDCFGQFVALKVWESFDTLNYFIAVDIVT